MQADLSSGVPGIRIARSCTAILTSEAVPLKNLVSPLWRDTSPYSRSAFEANEDVLAGLKGDVIYVGMNLHPLLVP